MSIFSVLIAIIVSYLIYKKIKRTKERYDFLKIMFLTKVILLYNIVKIAERKEDEVIEVSDVLYSLNDLFFMPFSWSNGFYIREEDKEIRKDFLTFIKKNKKKLKRFING